MDKVVYELIGYKDRQNGVDSVDLFIQQGKRIKELQENNNTLKRSRAHFKKVAENLVYLLKKLNRFIGEPQTRDLNYYKVIEDTKSYIEKLKQSQNQKAIEELEKVKEEMVLNGSDYCEIRRGTSPHNPTDYYAWFNYVVFREFTDNQIKKLGGEENE